MRQQRQTAASHVCYWLLFMITLFVCRVASVRAEEEYQRKVVTRIWLRTYFQQQKDLNPDAPDAKEALRQFEGAFGGKSAYTIGMVQQFTPRAPAKSLPTDPAPKGGSFVTGGSKLRDAPKWSFRGVLLRKSVEDVLQSEDVTGKSDITKTSKLTGASFSYARQYRTGTDAWTADGVVLFPFGYENKVPPGSEMILTSAYVLPSVSFKRITGTGDGDADSLVFRLGGAWVWTGGAFGTPREISVPGGAPLKNQYPSKSYSQTLSIDAAFETDFGTRRKIPAGELTWIPAVDLWGLKIGHYVNGFNGGTILPNLGHRIEFALYAAGGRHLENNDVKTAYTFFRAGPTLGLTLDPFFVKTFRVGATYQWLEAFVGPTERQHYVTAFAQVKLSNSIHLSLDYQEGGTDLSKKPVKQLTLGFRIIETFFAPKRES